MDACEIMDFIINIVALHHFHIAIITSSVSHPFSSKINHLRPTAIQKLLEMIGRVHLYPRLLVAIALDSDINLTTGSGGHPSM